MSRGDIWRILDIPATRDRALIRRAYAARLRVTNPEDDAEGFQALRAAYEQALDRAARAPSEPVRPDGLQASPPEAKSEAPPAPDVEPAPEPEKVSQGEIDALELELRQLAEAIHGDAASPEAAQAALDRLLASPAMDSVSVRDQVERHVANMVLGSGSPAFAGLVDSASAAFGWTSNRLGARSQLAAAVEARRDDAAFLSAIRRKSSGLNEAYLALTRPPTGFARLRYRLTLGLPRRVEQLLEEFDGRHGSLLAGLDPQALAWWRAYLGQPQFSPLFVWTSLLFSPLLAAIATEGKPYGLVGQPAFFAAWATVAAACGGLGALWVLGLARARAHWWRSRGHRASLWERAGWAPLVLANLIAAAIIPLPAGLWWVCAPLALGGLAWAIVTADRGGNQPVEMAWTFPTSWLPLLRIPLRLPRWAALMLGLIALVIFWAGADDNLPAGAGARIQIPVLAASLAFGAGHGALEAAWSRCAVQARIAGLVGFLVTAAALPFWLWSTAPGAAQVPIAATAVMVMVLLERIAVLGEPNTGLRDRLYYWGWLPASVAGAMAEEEARHGNAMLLFLGLWLLLSASVGVLGLLRRECQDLPAPRRARATA